MLCSALFLHWYLQVYMYSVTIRRSCLSNESVFMSSHLFTQNGFFLFALLEIKHTKVCVGPRLDKCIGKQYSPKHCDPHM